MRYTPLLTSAALAAVLAGQAIAAGEHAQGGTLTAPIITTTFVEDFNPFSGAQIELIRGTMFEPLYVHNAMAGEINWRLAESFSYGEDLMSWTVKIKDGLTWSDGETLDATDVAFSLNLGKEDATATTCGKVWSNMPMARGVGGSDALAVAANMSKHIFFKGVVFKGSH